MWSSYRHYLTGEDVEVEIESIWTARRRERLGIFQTIRGERKPEFPGLRKKRERPGHPPFAIPCYRHGPISNTTPHPA